MQTKRATVLGLSLAGGLALAACSESHTTDGDECPMGAVVPCVVGVAGGLCGDALMAPVCRDGAWVCPEGMVRPSECACSGSPPPGCSCGSTGWECADDGGVALDGAPMCPPDPGSLDGMPCAIEGASCGSCGDPCSFCNVVRCSSGTWERLEVFPDPACADAGAEATFPCGAALACVRWRDYCRHTISDVGGEPDGYSCGRIPDGCPDEGCACFDESLDCEEDGAGGVTITYPGG